MRNKCNPFGCAKSSAFQRGARKVMLFDANGNLFSHARVELIGSERRLVFCQTDYARGNATPLAKCNREHVLPAN